VFTRSRSMDCDTVSAMSGVRFADGLLRETGLRELAHRGRKRLLEERRKVRVRDVLVPRVAQDRPGDLARASPL